jgi:predicted O-methyltransferase YrrM
MMETNLRQLLAELEEAAQYHDAHELDRAQKMLSLEPATAQLLSMMVRSSRRTRVLEVGTSQGYSTIWLAWATSPAGGRVTSIDREAHKIELADSNLRRAGLRGIVDLIHGDATEVVSTLAGPFDCVFFDADRLSAPSQLALLVPKLTTDVLLFADNALSHPVEIADYLAAVKSLPQFEHLIVPIGKGLSIAYRSETHFPGRG